MRHGRIATLASAGRIIGAALLVAAGPASLADPDKTRATVLLEDLSSPKGIAIASKSSVFLGQGAYGPPGPALEYTFKGAARGAVTPLTDPVNIADVAATPDGAGWAIGGDLVLYRQAAPDDAIEPILDIAAYQVADPDPYNSDGDPWESNPFGIAALPSNDVLIADAAGNDVIRVEPERRRPYRRPLDAQAREDRPRRGSQPPAGAAGRGRADEHRHRAATAGRMSASWSAFPGTSGFGPRLAGRTPTPRMPSARSAQTIGHCSSWKSGFTSIIDLDFNRSTGALYVYEIARDGWLAFEEGFVDRRTSLTAVLLEVRKGQQDARARRGPALGAGRGRGRARRHGLRHRRDVQQREAAADRPLSRSQASWAEAGTPRPK